MNNPKRITIKVLFRQHRQELVRIKKHRIKQLTRLSTNQEAVVPRFDSQEVIMKKIKPIVLVCRRNHQMISLILPRKEMKLRALYIAWQSFRNKTWPNPDGVSQQVELHQKIKSHRNQTTPQITSPITATLTWVFCRQVQLRETITLALQ